MFPGMAGPPPMAGMGMPGMGPPPIGGPPNPASMAALDQLAQAPQGAGEKQTLQDATSQIQVALSRVMLRSPKAAKMLSDAIGKLQQALITLDQEAQQPMAPPPDLLGMMGGGMGQGSPATPGAGPF